MRLYARNCQVKQITLQECKDFCNTYHKQKGVSAPVNYGLFFNNELVQIMSFGSSRQRNPTCDWEMYRECSKQDYYILGGKSKLLKHFIQDKNPHAIISYCSLEEGFDGHSYLVCGFEFIRKQEGSYHYEKDGIVYSRFKFQKNSTLRKQGKKEPIQTVIESIGGIYNPDLTEKENAERNGFTRVEEKGNLVFELHLSDYVGYIYKTTCLVNNKVYVGQHKGEFTTQYLGSGTLFLRAVKKHGRDNFKVELVEQVQNKSFTDYQSELNELERKYIKEFNSLEPNGYNILTGGQGLTAYLNDLNHLSNEEYKQQRSLTSKKCWQNEDYRNNQMKIRSSQEWKESQSKKLSEAWTDEMKQKHSVMRKEYLKEHPMTEETKRKMVENYKKNNPDASEIQSKLKKEHFQNHPEAKELLAQKAKEAYLRDPSKYKKSEECKRLMSEKMKGRSNEKMKEVWKTQEYRDKWSEGIQGSWTEEKRQKAAEVAKRKWEEEKKNGISRSKEKLQSEEYRKMMSSKMKELYKNRVGATKGKHWWTDGENNVLSEKCPKGYRSGRCK